MKSFLFHTEFRAALFLSTVRFAFCAYRGGHQSITIDEAFMYQRFLAGSWWDIWGYFDAANHVLFSILAKYSVQLFGLSEFSLRLPTLIAGFFFMLGIFKVLRETVHSPAVRWVTFLALGLHPLLLDFSIAARGYGLALALLVWAIYFAMRRWHAASGLMLGLALSANLIMLFPVIGILVAQVVLVSKPWRERIRDFFVILAPCETAFGAICFGALRTATRENFYVGLPELRHALHSLIYNSIHATHRSGLFGKESAVHFLQYWILPLTLGFLLSGAWMLLRRGFHKHGFRLIPLFALTVTAAAIFAAHMLLDMRYPIDRLALHLFVLFGLAWAVAADSIPRLRAVSVLAGLLVVAQLATQLHGRYFSVWVEDMDDKEIAEQIRQLSANRPDHSVKVSASWFHQPTLEFYRQTLHITPLQPIAWNGTTIMEGHDFYVLGDNDMFRAANKPLRILFSSDRVLLATSW